MRDRLLFCVRHAFRSLQRERRRSLFAAFAIAVGVAAVVGLQTLSLSIGDSVTDDIQATHQGDVVVSTHGDEPFTPQQQRSALDGLLPGSQAVDWTWFLLANPDRPSFIAPSGSGAPGPLQWFQPYLVEPDKYPLYGELLSVEPEGVPLGRLLTSPGEIILSKAMAARLDVGVGDKVVVENSSAFVVKGLVANEDSGGVFAPYFVPPMPWFAYLDLQDPKAREVFGAVPGDATVLFIRTGTDEDAEELAREIEITTRLAESGGLGEAVGGNVFVNLPADAVGLRDQAHREISSIAGVTDLVEYHGFQGVTVAAVDGSPTPDDERPIGALVAVGGSPARPPAEMAHGRGLNSKDMNSSVMVVRGLRNPLGEVDGDRLGGKRTLAIGGREVTLEIVGITAGDSPAGGLFDEAQALAPLGGFDPAIPPSSISFLMTVPESEAAEVAARIARNVPGATAIEADSLAGVLLARGLDTARRAPVEVETAAARLPELEDTTDVMGRVIMVAGLASLAIGGIGIFNTMQVIVGRRTQEIGVLKALGLKGRQVTLLFMAEGLALGVVGSVAGVVLGIALSLALTGLGERFLQTEVESQLQTAPIYTGLIVGIVATTIFGFLPTLTASRVRPNVVLQPQAAAMPRTGRLLSLAVVLLLTAVMGLVATVFIKNPLIGMAGAYGALVVLALLTAILIGLVWIVGKIPSFGSINLKLSLRGLSRRRGRAASTLLALVIGVFAMASIVVLGGTLKDLADEISEDFVGGNVLLLVPDGDAEITRQASLAISSLDGPSNVVEDHQFDAARIVGINGEYKHVWGSRMIARRGVPAEGNPDLIAGRHLAPEDEGASVVVLGRLVAEDLDLKVGDALTFNIGGDWVDGVIVGGQETELEVVGITADDWAATGAFVDDGGFQVPLGALDSSLQPTYASFIITAPPSRSTALTEELTRAVPGAIAMEPQTVAAVFKDILDRITVFPAVLSALALFAGAVIIANSVALATMERRREIAMMKAVGAKGSRILTALLMENGIIGLIGGVIGVGLSITVLVVLNRLEPDIPATPDPLSVIVVVIVAVGVALAAAVTSAWPASREKPLSVLRYE